jgi:zinc/manganese transport system substrate-binding protein/manganese/iron transport system substrate-binding protein
MAETKYHQRGRGWRRGGAGLLVLLGLGLVLVLVLVLGLSVLPRALAQPTRPAAGLRVVASTSVLADLTRQVGGDRLGQVRSVVPAGVDVEDYDPRPEDLQAVAQADLVVVNGLALDRWAPRLVQAANPGVPTLVLSDGLPVLGLSASADEDIATNGNPHFWLDPQYAKVYVQRIHDQLVSLDPAGAATYDANTAAYLAQLDELDQWIQQQVASIPPENRKLVTFHEAFPYFAARYGFQLIGVITPSPGQEPSAGELAQLVDTVKAAHVKAVFSEAQFSPRLTQTLAQEADIQEVVTDLYNDSLGDPPADTYIGMMRYNVQRLVRALA